MIEAESTIGRDEYRDCLLCGLRVRRYAWPGAAVTRLCHGCLVRIEAELSAGLCEPCGRCGRHPDLCARTPCVPSFELASGPVTRQPGTPDPRTAGVA